MRSNKPLVWVVMVLLPVVAFADEAALRRRVTENEKGEVAKVRRHVELKPTADNKVPFSAAGLYVLDDGTSSVAMELQSKPKGAFDRTIYIRVDTRTGAYTAFEADQVPAGIEVPQALRDANAELRKKEPAFGDLAIGAAAPTIDTKDISFDGPPPVCGEPEITVCDEQCSGGVTIQTTVYDPIVHPMNRTTNSLNWFIAGAQTCRWRANGYGSCEPTSQLSTWFVSSCPGSWGATGYRTASGQKRGYYYNYDFGLNSLRTDAMNGSFISYFDGFLNYGPIFSVSGEYSFFLWIDLRVMGGIDMCG